MHGLLAAFSAQLLKPSQAEISDVCKKRALIDILWLIDALSIHLTCAYETKGELDITTNDQLIIIIFIATITACE